MTEEQRVIISLDEYERLKQRDTWLQCLEAAGVDNWDGLDYAQELYMRDE